MEWVYLITAGLFEIAWALGLKYSEGFTRLLPSIGTAVAMIFSFYFISASLRTIPLGTAYAVWTGIGAVGTAVAGIILFSEPRELFRILCILVIISGIAGLMVTSGR